MELENLTGNILQAAFTVSNELGCGFLEKVYETALLVSLKEKGLSAAAQQPFTIRYHGVIVGVYFADIIVDNRVIVEVKAAQELRPEHIAQVLNYLKASGLPVGMLFNFAKPKLEYRRFTNRFLAIES